ncbi:MAG: NAD(P)H-hydrate dehydratase [Ruminococcus sp.]|nr:NAD(P)H-hydrate dehydratase [Ruminococcus sp.]
MRYPIDKNLVKSTIGRRPADADKTSVGTLLSICGSYGMAGAAIMSSKAALRSGIGLLKLCVPRSIYPIMAGAVPEAVFYPVEDVAIADFDFASKSKYCSAILIGCGLSINSETRSLVKNVIKGSVIPLILDADALNIVSENTEFLKCANTAVTITPHDREFSRLYGKELSDIKANREEYVLSFASEYNVNVVLKGHKTVVASPSGDLLYNDALGNAGMATGGSGDVLAGIIASLTAQGFDAFKSACSGVYVHALAGDIAKDRFGEISMLPTDIIECLPEAYKLTINN